ncbi:MAG: 1-phosphofructokinase [Clostridia bacterium]|nr:1-phosphofructokinase [Clostridia bacterium]
MIYTVTFNPAIDYVVSVENLIAGTVNRTKSEKLYYGGKGINVSLILNRLGIENIAYGFLAGFTGEEIEKGLREQGVKTDFITLKDGLSRINVKIMSSYETEINGQGPDIPQNAIDDLFGKLNTIKSGDTLVLAGSIPQTLPSDIYETILNRLSGKGIRFVVDATGDLLLNVLKYHPFLIKPNNFELGELFGRHIKTKDEIISCAKELQNKGAENVLVSLGGNGAILVSADGQIYRIKAVSGKVRNTVGSGDSMVAGFIAGYIKTNDYKYALELGSAAGTATAFSDDLATYDEIMENLKKLQSQN